MQLTMAGKRTTQINSYSHETWQMVYPMLRNMSSIWSDVVVLQNEHVPCVQVETACGCMGHQLVCTMLCACGSGPACSNPFNAKERMTYDTDEVDNESSEYNNDRDDYFIICHKFITVMP